MRSNKILFLLPSLILILTYSACQKNNNLIQESTNSTTELSQQTAQILPLLIEHGPRKHPLIALTFDADMTPSMLQKYKSGVVKSWYDERITATLEENQVPSTIFLTGMWAELYPKVVKKIANNPLYEIGNHSYDHAGFTDHCYTLAHITDKKSEIIQTQDIVKKLTGKTPKYFRFPGGCYHESDLVLVKSLGLQTIAWDVVSGDAFSKDPQKIIDTVLSKTQNGSIIVMHSDGGPNTPTTALALPKIITELKQKGFQFVTISQLLNQ